MSVARLESIVERLQRSANVRSVFGEPIERGEKTVVPVARVAFGFGGGYGRGGDAGDPEGQGGGGGGGATATPLGALEIADGETEFVRFGSRKRSLAVLLVGFVVGLLVGRRSNAS